MHLRPSVDSHRCFLLVCLIRSHLRASVVLGKTFLSKQAFMCQSRKSTGKLMMESFHLEYILPLWTLVRCHGFSLTCCNFGSARSLNKIIWRMPKQLAFMSCAHIHRAGALSALGTRPLIQLTHAHMLILVPERKTLLSLVVLSDRCVTATLSKSRRPLPFGSLLAHSAAQISHHPPSSTETKHRQEHTIFLFLHSSSQLALGSVPHTAIT